ncbi:hypothetical protein RND81_02G228300 [Saponaria officinalis]|uniref:Uncharacterized protein n=1 Tax=Saponaria officinalis TaxID=3572 RepID=A0AAW1MP03_SAPOF
MDFDVVFDDIQWRVTGFYGWPLIQDRHLSWQQLRILAAQSTSPWLCVGDYNEILYSNEMKGGTRAQWQMNNFRDAANDCGIRDLPCEGYEFTYDNGQDGEANRQSRIDRAMGTEDWLNMFPYSKLVHLDREWSDHAPLKVLFDSRKVDNELHPRKFRFEHIWVGEDGCEEAIRGVWNLNGGDLLATINRCGKELLRWKGVSIGKILRELNKKRKRLKILNEGPRDAVLVRERRNLVQDISKLRCQEEKFWRQRSRTLWLKDGDKNTKFFHRKAGQRRQKNQITKIVDEEGRIHEGTRDIKDVAVKYFEGMFATSDPTSFDDLLLWGC